MTKIDPVIAVRDVDASAQWYENVFGLKNASPKGHGFAVLKSGTNEIVLCLHRWQMDGHPTMTDPGVAPGNGLMLYFRTDEFDKIYARAKSSGIRFEEDVHFNPKPGKKEFALRDPDGYFLTVSDITNTESEMKS